MTRVFGWVRMAAAAAVLAAALGFAAMELAKRFVDVNGYRSQITNGIAQATGLQASFERLEWLPYRPGVAAVFPTLGRNGVSIRAKRIEAVVWLPSLVFGPPRLSRISVDGLVVNAERGEEGGWNLARLVGGGAGKGGTMPDPPDDIIITNGTVLLSDAYAPRHAEAVDETRQSVYDFRTAGDYLGGEGAGQNLTPQFTPAAPEEPAALFGRAPDAGQPRAVEPPAPKKLALRGIDLHFHVGRWLLPSRVQFSSELIDPSLQEDPLYRRLKPGRIELSLKSRIGAPDWDWNNSITKGTITVDSVYSGSFDAYLSGLLPEHYSRKVYSFNLKFDGRPSAELPFSGSVSARTVEQITNPEMFTGSALEPRRFDIAGAIRPNIISLDRIEAYLPDARLDVRLQVANYRAPDPAVSLRATTSFVDLDKVDRLIPPTYLATPLARAIRKSVGGGRFRVTNLSFDGPLSAFVHITDPQNMERVSGRLEVEDAAFLIKGMKQPVKAIKGVIDVKGNLVSFQNLSAVHGKSAITRLRGSISGLGTAPVLDAVMTATVDVAELRQEALTRIASKNLHEMIEPVRDVEGTVSATVNVQADLMEEKITELDADIVFSNVGFRHANFKVPVSGFNGTLHVTPVAIEIKDAAFNVEASAITVNGAVRRYTEPEYDMDLTIDIAGGIPRMADSPLLSARLREGLTGNVIGNITLSGTLDNLAFSQEFNLTQANVKLLDVVEKRPGKPLTIAAKGTLHGSRLAIDEGRIAFGNSRVRFRGAAPDARSWKGYGFTVAVDTVDLADGPAYVTAFGEGMVKGAVNGEMRITDGGAAPAVSGTLDAKIEDLDLAHLERFKDTLPVLGYLKMEGNIKGDVTTRFSPGALPKFNGWISGKNVSFYTVLPRKFRNVSGTAKLKGNLVTWSGVPFTSGNSAGKASGSLLIHKKKPVLRLDVRASRLELGDTVWLEGEPDPWWTEDSAINPELFVHARSAAGTLTVIPYENIDLDMHYHRDKFTFKSVRFGAYQGTCEAAGDINVEGEKPLFNARIKLAGMEMEPLIKDIWPDVKRVTGKMALEGNFAGEGLLWKDLRHTLDGTMKFESDEGLLSQIGGMADIFSAINMARLREKRVARQEGEGLPYQSITGTMTIKKGTGHTDNILVEGSVMRMSAAGDLYFNDGTVKLLIGVKPFTSVDSIISNIPVAGPLLTGEQKSLVISYYHMTGPMDDPVVKAVPGESVARAIFGIFQRALEAPARALSTEKGLESRKEKPAEKMPGKN